MEKSPGASEAVLWDIYRAASKNKMERVFYFLDSGRYCVEKFIRRLICAKEGSASLALPFLLKRYARFFPAQQFLDRAVDVSNVYATKVLLELKADPSARDSRVLHVATAADDPKVEIVQLLLDYGAKVKEADLTWGGRIELDTHLPTEVYSLLVKAGLDNA